MKTLDINAYARKHLVPLDAMVELTYKCNLACRHCYIKELLNQPDGEAVLSTDRVKGLVDELKALGTFSICLTGGEVLLRRDLFEIISHITSQGFVFTVLTNGLLIKRREGQIRDVCGGNKLCRRFRVSLYGTTAEVHDSVTGRAGSFVQSTAGIETLVSIGIPTTIGFVITQSMAHQIPELDRFASRLGAEWGVIKDIIPTIKGDARFLAERLDLRNERAVLTINKDRITRFASGASIPEGEESCGIAKSTVKIDPFGRVFPCSAYYEPAGNLNEAPLDQIWRESPVMQKCRRLFDVNTYSACGDCAVKKVCVDRCIGHFASETGEMFTPPSYFCAETGIVARHLAAHQ